MDDTELRADSTLLGYYRQAFDAGPHGTFGHAEMLGLCSGLRYVERHYLDSHDMYASTHIFGGDTGYWFGLGRLRGHVEVEARYDFSAAASLPLARYEALHGEASLKSVLTLQGYEFGAGPAERVQGELTFASASAGGYFDHAYYHAIGGLDREQSHMRGDVDGSDDIVEYGAWVMEELPFFPAYVRAFVDRVVHESWLGELAARRSDRRLGIGAGLDF
jgi:hypothetical protein